MEINILAIQPGTVKDGMTNKEYFNKQIEYMDNVINSAEEKDKPYLVTFPELMTGIYFGFVREKCFFESAEDFLTGETTQTMLKKSKEHNIHICYSLFERAVENGKTVYYNTMGLVSPIRGVIGKYRKIHLPGGDLRYNPCYEKYYFLSGDSLPVFELDNGVKIAMMLCYDRSFPEVWRTYYLKRAEIICVATCTMGLRKDMFVTELQTRALESHSFVIALNRAGEEKTEFESVPRVHFGKTLVAGPLGDIVEMLDDTPWTHLSLTLNLDEITYARGRLNWERDRHPELYSAVSDEAFEQKGLIFERGF